MSRVLLLLLIVSVANSSYISRNIARSQGEMIGYQRGLQQGMMASSGMGYPMTTGVGMTGVGMTGVGMSGLGMSGIGMNGLASSAAAFEAGRAMGKMEGVSQGMAVGMNHGRAIGHTQGMMTGTALGTMYKRSVEAKVKN